MMSWLISGFWLIADGWWTVADGSSLMAGGGWHIGGQFGEDFFS
jgi:hypothetical protein